VTKKLYVNDMVKLKLATCLQTNKTYVLKVFNKAILKSMKEYRRKK
jgi:serine/threonine protein kinase